MSEHLLPRILDGKEHHRQMHRLKAKLGDPRPDEWQQLSLIHPDSLYAYWGYNGNGHRRRLSQNPDDYAWDTPDNNRSLQWPIIDQPHEDDYSEDSFP